MQSIIWRKACQQHAWHNKGKQHMRVRELSPEQSRTRKQLAKSCTTNCNSQKSSTKSRFLKTNPNAMEKRFKVEEKWERKQRRETSEKTKPPLFLKPMLSTNSHESMSCKSNQVYVHIKWRRYPDMVKLLKFTSMGRCTKCKSQKRSHYRSSRVSPIQ